jgi:RNA polymerase sigma-70 factor (ECF subfamily)
VALAEVKGPRAAIESMKAIQESALSSYYLYYAVLGEFEARLGNLEAATRHLRQALKLTEIKSEQQLLLNRLAECREKSGEEESVFAAGERSAS